MNLIVRKIKLAKVKLNYLLVFIPELAMKNNSGLALLIVYD